jgi:hypothetical protein
MSRELDAEVITMIMEAALNDVLMDKDAPKFNVPHARELYEIQHQFFTRLKKLQGDTQLYQCQKALRKFI